MHGLGLGFIEPLTQQAGFVEVEYIVDACGRLFALLYCDKQENANGFPPVCVCVSQGNSCIHSVFRGAPPPIVFSSVSSFYLLKPPSFPDQLLVLAMSDNTNYVTLTGKNGAE